MLILGGTAEARELAAAAVAVGVPIVSSLAGRVSRPARPAGPVRIGGFGGADGLLAYLLAQRIRAVVDATHPFAATISVSAATACAAAGVPLLRLARPGWGGRAAAAGWHWVESTAAAAEAAGRIGHRPFLTTGRQTLADFLPLADRHTLVRVVEPPATVLPPAWQVILDRGPYTLAGELQLLAAHRVDVLVTKDSGGAYTCAKLDAAARRGVPVVIVRRPPAVAGTQVIDAQAALHWMQLH